MRPVVMDLANNGTLNRTNGTALKYSLSGKEPMQGSCFGYTMWKFRSFSISEQPSTQPRGILFIVNSEQRKVQQLYQ